MGALACTYQEGTWECRGDGYLWDADSDGWVESDTSHPCPACNTREYLTDRAENSRGTRWSSYQWVYTSGAEHWRNAMAVALAANPVGAGGIISEIGPVECDDWRDPDHPDVNDMISVAIHGTTEIAIAKVTPSQVRS